MTTISFLYINLGLDYFDNIDVIVKDPDYKKCMDEYINTLGVCKNIPSYSKVASKFKNLNQENVNDYFSCNPYIFMPYVISVSSSFINQIKNNVDFLIAGEMCNFDYNTNYKDRFIKNSIKEYVSKPVTSAQIQKLKIRLQEKKNRGRKKDPRASISVGYAKKGDSNIPSYQSEVDIALHGSIEELRDSTVPLTETEFSEIKKASKKQFFVGTNKEDVKLLEEIDTKSNENIICDKLCDELQIVKTQIKEKQFILINVHNRELANTDFNKYSDSFTKFINTVIQTHKDHNILIMGDFNIGQNNSNILKISDESIPSVPKSDILIFINEMKKLGLEYKSSKNVYAEYDKMCNYTKNINVLIFYKLTYNADVTVEHMKLNTDQVSKQKKSCDQRFITSSHYPIILKITERSNPVQSVQPKQPKQPTQPTQLVKPVLTIKQNQQSSQQIENFKYKKNQGRKYIEQKTIPPKDLFQEGGINSVEYKSKYVTNKNNYANLKMLIANDISY